MDEERRGTIGFSKVLVTDQGWDWKIERNSKSQNKVLKKYSDKNYSTARPKIALPVHYFPFFYVFSEKSGYF